MVSSAHNVCPKGYYVAIVSTIAENDVNNHLELQPGLERLGQIEEIFMAPPIALYEPLDDGTKDNVYISRSYDATSHFETTTGENSASFFSPLFPLVGSSNMELLIPLPDDIRDLYRRAEGQELVVEGLREGTNLVGEE
jgi:Rab GDP dissociation inhibitor